MAEDDGSQALPEGAEAVLAAAAAAAEQLPALPESDHIILAAAAATAEQLSTASRLSITGSGEPLLCVL